LQNQGLEIIELIRVLNLGFSFNLIPN